MKFTLIGAESKRLLFKKVDIAYFIEWLKFFEDPETSKYWIQEKVKPIKACEDWYVKQQYRYDNDLGGMHALIEKSSGEFIGHCGILIQKVNGMKEYEIAYSLLPKYWNRGYASEAAEKCMNIAFENKWEESLISIISIVNIPSEKVAIKNKMKIDFQTTYKENEVNIFRITRKEWLIANK